MKKSDYSSAIRNRIKQAKAGSVFAMVDFADLAPNNAANRVVTRLAAEGVLTPVLRGIYQKPKYSELLGEYVLPYVEDVAAALARRCGWTIRADGDTALNQLGLSTQVPAVWSYVSDGTYKEYSFDSTTIKFKRTTNKEISKLSPKTALVIQAIKALGKEHVSDEIIEKIRSETSADERTTMLKEAQYATAWIYGIIKVICR